MTITVVVATGNPHKVVELQAILGPLLPGIVLAIYDGPEPVEDGETFAANALIKSRAAAAHTGLPAIADDSGICVDALGGAPGIHSARYAGTRDSDDNVRLLLSNLDGVEDRAAHFACAAALSMPDGLDVVETATWPGRVLREPAGAGGFGYDPIFQPDGEAVSAAELGDARKNELSHRTLAFHALAPAIRAAVAGSSA